MRSYTQKLHHPMNSLEEFNAPPLLEGEKKPKDYWSECGQIFFHYGKGFGLTDTLRNICLGNEEDIKRFLETGELGKEFNETQIQVLNSISDYRKEQGIGTNVRTATMERAGYHGSSGRKQKATRPFTFRKRLPVRLSRTKGKSLSRR